MRLTHKQAREMGIDLPKRTGKGKSPMRMSANARPKDALGVTAKEKLFDGLCEAHGLPRPVHEYHFAREVGREWRFDHLFDGWLALEEEGGAYGVGAACPACGGRAGGAHRSVGDFLKDIEKYNAAAMLGYVVIRCLPEDVTTGAAFALVKKALNGEQP